MSEDGPILKSWDGNGKIPTSLVKMTLDASLELDFQRTIVDAVPNHRKAAWIEGCLTKDAMVVHILPFILREGINFPCPCMNKYRIEANRVEQLQHQKSCDACSLLAATDFHPLKVRIPTYLIWQAVYKGTLEMWNTRNESSPSFNNLIMKNMNEKPDDDGSHLIVSGRGRHNNTTCDNLNDLPLSVGSTQATLTLFVRLISDTTQVKGRVWLSPKSFRPNAELLLQALCNETDYKLSKMLEKVALQLSPLLREVPVKFRNQEHLDLVHFKTGYYNTGGYKFIYLNNGEGNSPVNTYLDMAGALLLPLLSRIHSLGLKLSLSMVMGLEFRQIFAKRNLIPDMDGFRLRAELNLGELFFKDDITM